MINDVENSTVRLYKGDCLEIMDNIADKSVDMILCDLPYGMTACEWDNIIPFEELWRQYDRIVKDNGAIVLNCMQPFTTKLIASNLKNFKYCWYWAKGLKTGFLNAKKQPLRNVEDIAVFYKKQCTYNPQMVKGKKHKRGGAPTGTACYSIFNRPPRGWNAMTTTLNK